MELRYGTTADAELLSTLGARTFLEAFEKDNTPENMDLYIKESFSTQIQSRELSAPDVIFIIAESEGIPIGYLQLVLGNRDDAIEGVRPMEIRRIYAIQEYLGRGVGSELMKAAIEESHRRGCDCVWLGVWERNLRAIAFYNKWGFHEVGTHIFMLGEEPQNDLIMELALTESSKDLA